MSEPITVLGVECAPIGSCGEWRGRVVSATGVVLNVYVSSLHAGSAFVSARWARGGDRGAAGGYAEAHRSSLEAAEARVRELMAVHLPGEVVR